MVAGTDGNLVNCSTGNTPLRGRSLMAETAGLSECVGTRPPRWFVVAYGTFTDSRVSSGL
jgi:hypothetical protein